LTPLLFALVDAVLWAEASGMHQYAREARNYHHRAGDWGRKRIWHDLMADEKRRMGAWRSLWGVL
jgi:hypothetical protein